MICPKCSFDVPEGPECPACGVIMDKFNRRGGAGGHAPGQASPLLAPIKPQGHRAPRARKKPVGKGFVLGILFLIVAVAGVTAWDLIRHYMESKKIYKAMVSAVNPAKYRKARMTGDLVYQAFLTAARMAKLKVKREQVYIRIEGHNSSNGEVVSIDIQVLVPRKLLGLFKYPIYKKATSRFASISLPNGYQHYETDPNSKIAIALKAKR